ncbi:MAG: ABC transporter ATP-binding protein [Alphaproteobacteria bacterium]|jgi:ABC-2 type transport system ATP-binding protein|nr:ABC transporter ATP-binding protein [Alphaproteobacteria bacterium]
MKKMKILEIKNLKKVYKNGKEALKGINLSINKGEFVGLLGVNGAGKSTMINILSDVVVKSSGEVKGCGFDMDTQRLDFKRHIGIVPQDINFDPFFTPYEVLKSQQGLWGLKYDHQRILDILEHVGLSDKAHAYARSLSGGMKRRLLVAKAIIHDPDIIILDEPTAGVDVDLRQQLWSFLQKLNSEGKTIILTTHYLEEAQHLCEKIAIINAGELIAYEDKDSLIAKIGSKHLELLLNKDFVEAEVGRFSVEKSTENNRIVVVYKEEADVGEILENIVKMGYHIDKIKMIESNLEEVFLKLTHS